MKYIFAADNATNMDSIKKCFTSSECIFIESPENISRLLIKKDDIAVIDFTIPEESIKAQEYIAFRCRIICFYSPSEEGYYPMEKFCYTRFIPRPFSPEKVKDIASMMHNEEIAEEDASYALIGSSDQMDGIRTKIAKYAKTNCSVHFSGSTGTGKNVAARRLHFLSEKRNRKMIYVNCGAFSNTGLIESSFFGHAKGSYTGSSNSRSGILKNADKSTLFLDEIENMSLSLQELLLDTIDSGRFRTVGTDKEISSDFRIITASNIPLESLLESGKLRYDFYYRIAEREINMPDLKDHKEDIPELIQDYERRNGIIRYRIRDYSALLDREWKGNVRELYKVISQIHEEIEDGEKLVPDDFLSF